MSMNDMADFVPSQPYFPNFLKFIGQSVIDRSQFIHRMCKNSIADAFPNIERFAVKWIDQTINIKAKLLNYRVRELPLSQFKLLLLDDRNLAKSGTP